MLKFRGNHPNRFFFNHMKNIALLMTDQTMHKFSADICTLFMTSITRWFTRTKVKNSLASQSLTLAGTQRSFWKPNESRPKSNLNRNLTFVFVCKFDLPAPTIYSECFIKFCEKTIFKQSR